MIYTNGNVTVEAMQVTHQPDELLQWLTDGGWANRGPDRVLREGGVVILFDDGLFVVPVGDYIVKRDEGFDRQAQATFETSFKPA